MTTTTNTPATVQFDRMNAGRFSTRPTLFPFIDNTLPFVGQGSVDGVAGEWVCAPDGDCLQPAALAFHVGGFDTGANTYGWGLTAVGKNDSNVYRAMVGLRSDIDSDLLTQWGFKPFGTHPAPAVGLTWSVARDIGGAGGGWNGMAGLYGFGNDDNNPPLVARGSVDGRNGEWTMGDDDDGTGVTWADDDPQQDTNDAPPIAYHYHVTGRHVNTRMAAAMRVGLLLRDRMTGTDLVRLGFERV